MLQKKLHQGKNQNISNKTYDKNDIDIRTAKHTIRNAHFGLPEGRNAP